MRGDKQKWIVRQLMEHGRVSRNQAIREKYITRLGAVINQLNKGKWKIEGHYEENEYGGRDYIYVVKEGPRRIQHKVIIRDGKSVAVPVN